MPILEKIFVVSILLFIVISLIGAVIYGAYQIKRYIDNS